ncbi:IS3 family transposase [bacterium]|nr:IS3 family transposase [bacterium]MDC1349856.1 IS3 family transposase [Akkermansiaceae bacterium]
MELERKAVLLSKSHPRYGYRRITALMRRDDHVVNEVRVQALRRKHCLQVRKKQCKTKRLRPEQAQRLEACHAGHVWCWDFVYDQTECGSSFRLLSVLDEYTRECYSLRPRP